MFWKGPNHETCVCADLGEQVLSRYPPSGCSDEGSMCVAASTKLPLTQGEFTPATGLESVHVKAQYMSFEGLPDSFRQLEVLQASSSVVCMHTCMRVCMHACS